jgi:4-amino-4-deoxy-L-arabinose transferase-like glycosyltransferase
MVLGFEGRTLPLHVSKAVKRKRAGGSKAAAVADASATRDAGEEARAEEPEREASAERESGDAEKESEPTAPPSGAEEPPSEPEGKAVPSDPSRSKGYLTRVFDEEVGARRFPDFAVLRGAGLGLVGLACAFLLAANNTRVPHGAILGVIALAVAAAGFLDFFGLLTLRAKDAIPFLKTPLGPQPFPFLTKPIREPLAMTPIVTVPVALLVVIGGGVALGYERLPWVILIALAVLAISALTRPAMLVFVVAAALFLPCLGVYGLWDPWETHYGEVTREILARDDWISLWWAQENWFWSKPILIFWSEAISLSALGVDPMPDANPLHPEWALRLPIAIMSLTAVMSVYAAISKIFNRRAGVLSALVLATMPHFFFLSHQAITDMPFVANMTVAMCLLALALAEDPDREVKVYRIGPITLSGRHLVLATLFMLVVPQILYLLSRNIGLVTVPVGEDGGRGFMARLDQFEYGSAFNFDVPGNARNDRVGPDVFLLQPAVQAQIWLLGLTILLLRTLWERRAQTLYVLGFYIFCALSFMGKGIPGFALPGLIALLFLIASRRWSVLLEGRLRIATGMLTVLTVGAPWYVAMYGRHGAQFLDRLLIHDHINRLAAGVHGDNGTVEYFMEQLGFAMFPWIALVPAALTMYWWYRKVSVDGVATSTAADHQRSTILLMILWFASGFILFSSMVTKFHHYIFPVVPAAAILVGILLDRLFGARPEKPSFTYPIGSILAVLAGVPLVLAIGGLWGDLRGVIPDGLATAVHQEWVLRNPLPLPIVLGLLATSSVLAGGAWFLLRFRNDEAREESSFDWKGAFAVALAAGAVVVSFVGRDLSWVTDGRPWGYERLILLFVYNYARPWPEEFDYRPMLTGFGVAAGLLFAIAVVPQVRGVAIRAVLGVAIAFTAWVLNVYMIDLSPHWGQRELVAKYYELRSGPEEPILAWQMNWKGENFYTGNRVYVFVDLDNRAIREWIDAHRDTCFFVLLEHGRVGSFRGLVPGRELIEQTDKKLCNKFILIQVNPVGSASTATPRAPPTRERPLPPTTPPIEQPSGEVLPTTPPREGLPSAPVELR